VDQPLWDAFYEAYKDRAKAWFSPSGRKDHYFLDLAKACRDGLLLAGMHKERIAMPDLCTCCNPDLLFSHRACGPKRGNLSVVMKLQ